MAFAGSFKLLIDQVSVASDFLDFLIKQKVFDEGALGLAAASEADIKTDLVDVAKAAGVKFESIGDVIQVKKLWSLCRKSMASSANRCEVSVDTPLPDDVERDLKKQWVAKHGFVLIDAYLLTRTLQGQLWRECGNASRPSLPLTLMESIRTLSCIDKKTGHQLAVSQGKPVECVEVVADGVSKHIEIFSRARAYLYTLAYTCVFKQTFFDFQTALLVSEKILVFVTTTFSGSVPPVGFFVTAWASTIHYWAEQLRIQGTDLIPIVTNFGAWEHLWTRWSPPARQSADHSLPSGSLADPPKNLQIEIDRLNKDVRRFQAEKDRAVTALRDSRAGGKNAGGRGGGSGKGSGDSHGKNSRRDDRNDGKRRRH